MRVLKILESQVLQAPAAEVRRDKCEPREHVKDSPHALGIVIIVAVVAAVHEDRIASLQCVVKFKHARVVHRVELRVRMNLDAAQAHVARTFHRRPAAAHERTI